jgi:predicted nuclease of predicted toxin-antitoxin system
MTYRLLFDENLSPELVELAIAAGYVNSTCVRDRGLRAVKD